MPSRGAREVPRKRKVRTADPDSPRARVEERGESGNGFQDQRQRTRPERFDQAPRGFGRIDGKAAHFARIGDQNQDRLSGALRLTAKIRATASAFIGSAPSP